MSELDMQITNQSLPVIQFNFDDIKASLQATVSQYSNLLVTDDTLSVCKRKQGELAGLRTKIDKYRLEKKKEMSVPITEFEDKCKELISLVATAEKPLKDGIQVYDDMKRETKRQEALKIIADSVSDHALAEKYAKQLVVIDKYMNLTAKSSEVKEDVEQKVFILLEQQKKEQEMLEIIQDTIDNENKTVKTPLKLSQFQRLIDLGMFTKDVLNEIKKRAEQIREAEKPVEIPKQEPAYEGACTHVGTYLQPEPIQPVATPEEPPDMYFVELRVVGTRENIKSLGDYLKINKYDYKVTHDPEKIE
jgi:hypothetical protein